jgi:hypothetical protein
MLSHCAACGDLPDYFHLIIAHADDFVKQTGDGAAVIRDDADAFTDLWFGFTGGEIHQSMLF